MQGSAGLRLGESTGLLLASATFNAVFDKTFGAAFGEDAGNRVAVDATWNCSSTYAETSLQSRRGLPVAFLLG